MSEINTCPGGTLYTIRPGDTYFNLAQRFGTTVEAIIAANPGVDPNNLQIGMTICIPVAPVPSPCPGGFTYVIKAGDTFFNLARRFGTTVEALIAANPGVDPNNLQIGMTICIPVTPVPVPCPGGFTYVIKAGDTFFNLARRFGTTVEALIAANPGVDPNSLRIGQEICIPAPTPIPTCPGIIYTVVPGDTIFGIARRFNTTVDAILALNPGLDPDRLQIGQAICIPSRCPAFTTPYAIRAGDTLFSIARRFQIEVEDILSTNPGLDPRSLRIGQIICLPI